MYSSCKLFLNFSRNEGHCFCLHSIYIKVLFPKASFFLFFCIFLFFVNFLLTFVCFNGVNQFRHPAQSAGPPSAALLCFFLSCELSRRPCTSPTACDRVTRRASKKTCQLFLFVIYIHLIK
jgi:hypothetical protein